MKKSMKKPLLLTTETVRPLAEGALREVAGGKSSCDLRCTTPIENGGR